VPILWVEGADDPLLDPPGVCARFHGFRVGDGSEVANSVVTALPKTIPPAALILDTDVASKSGTKSAYTLEPQAVSIPAV